MSKKGNEYRGEEMLNEKRLKLMTRMAIYENHEGKDDFKMNEYYQKDYASLNTWISIIWATIGYGIIIGAVLLVFLDKIFSVASLSGLLIIAGTIVIGYLMLIVIVGIISYNFYKKKYLEARKRIKRFNNNLTRLGKMYEKEKR